MKELWTPAEVPGDLFKAIITEKDGKVLIGQLTDMETAKEICADHNKHGLTSDFMDGYAEGLKQAGMPSEKIDQHLKLFKKLGSMLTKHGIFSAEGNVTVSDGE